MCLGIPGRIVEIVDPGQQRAIADVDGVRREISVSLLGLRQPDGSVTSTIEVDGSDAVTVDDWVLIHVGFAMSRIDEDEAAATLAALRAYGDPYQQEMEEYAADGTMDPLRMFADEVEWLAPDGAAASGPEPTMPDTDEAPAGRS
jgi:hydrogenase expression/formation protein HypC